MSYGTNNRNGGYSGQNRHSVNSFQSSRSKRSQSMDALRTSKRIAKTEDQWLKDPSHYDLPGVDTKKEDKPKEIIAIKASAPDGDFTVYNNFESNEKAEQIARSLEAQKKIYSNIEIVTSEERLKEIIEKERPAIDKELSVDNLLGNDEFAKKSVQDLISKGNYPNRAMQIYVNSVEGDISQLPPKLAEHARKSGWLNQGSVEGSSATYNEATGWMAISFSGIPAPEIRAEMKASGFRYNPMRKQWVAKWYPDREALAKKIAGEVQQVKIEPNWAKKAEHAAELSEKHAEKADELHDKAHRLSDSIPFGQPVLPNHHSTQGHLNDLSKIDKWHRQGVDEKEIANNYAKQAERYGRKATGESLITIGNRIKKLEAERRSIKRSLIGEIVEVNGKLYRRKGSQPSPEREAELKNWLSKTESRLAVEKERYVAGGGILDKPAKH